MEELLLYKCENATEADNVVKHFAGLHDIDHQPENVLITFPYLPVYIIMVCPSYQLADRLAEQIGWVSPGVDRGSLIRASLLTFTGSMGQLQLELSKHYSVKKVTLDSN